MIEPPSAPRSADRRGGAVWTRVAFGLGGAIRHATFVVLLTARPLVHWVARRLALVCLLCGLGYGLLKGWSTLPCLVLLGASVAITALLLVYEGLVALTSPPGFEWYWY